MGASILTEEDYRYLQAIDKFDEKHPAGWKRKVQCESLAVQFSVIDAMEEFLHTIMVRIRIIAREGLEQNIFL